MFYKTFRTGIAIREQHPPPRRLIVATYSTFASQMGPGTDLLRRFKEQCQCDVDVINAGDSVVMLKRLLLKKDQFVADVVLGLDPLTLPQAEREMAWKPITIDREHWVPEIAEFKSDKFIPFDWSPMTFIYRSGEIEPPQSLADLTQGRFQKAIAFQDPRVSTPGLQFVIWTLHQMGDQAQAFFGSLKASVETLSPSWALSYGMFKRGQAKMVFSYQTSVMFHWLEEKNHAYQAANFPDGHPFQVEFAAIPAQCRSCELAESFVKALMSPEGQATLMNKNYMLPVLKDVIEGSAFQNLPALKLIPWTELSAQLKDLDRKAEDAARALQ